MCFPRRKPLVGRDLATSPLAEIKVVFAHIRHACAHVAAYADFPGPALALACVSICQRVTGFPAVTVVKFGDVTGR